MLHEHTLDGVDVCSFPAEMCATSDMNDYTGIQKSVQLWVFE